ncbi:HIRA-interacting protein 3 [Hemicordylus capensis]|uniref:HIRA-interacting protein 3 n=1 Tax=Hemicordylus capensis TaxID=884348 RepID=UPI0023030A47|nr:HIRA-interacting protein 3 [Hemicordylus capensis]
MAVASGGREEDMQAFVRSVFQGSPDLSVLTHAIVRKKYLAHIQQESLTKEEKEKFKQLVEEELVKMQVDDSSSNVELFSKLHSSIKSGGQKRQRSSDISNDEAKSRQEQKKQRAGIESEVSLDEEDSGIDSKKIHKPAGEFAESSDQGDSGKEGHPDGSESNEQNAKNERMTPSQKANRETSGQTSTKKLWGRKQRNRSGISSSSDLEEEISRCKNATKVQRTRYENESNQELKGRKFQRKMGFDKEQKWTDGKGKGKNRRMKSESEEESEPLPVGKMLEKKVVDWSENEEEGEEKVGGTRRKAEVSAGQRTRKAQDESESEDESGSDSEEEDRIPKTMASNKLGRKNVCAKESESDSDETEGKRQIKKEMPRTKTRRVSGEKWNRMSESDSEESEEPKRQIKKGRMKKAQMRNVGERRGPGKERKENEKSNNPEKKQRKCTPKKSVSSSESNSEEDQHKGSRQKKKGIGGSDGSQSEAENGRKGGSKSQPVTVSSGESESESKEAEAGSWKKRRMLKKRSGDVSGSESSQEEGKLKKKGTEKSQRKSVSEIELENDSGDSGSELGKKKNEGHQKKGTQKPKRSNSKEESRNESEEEKSSSSEDNPSSFKGQHQGKDREHSGKSEEHPAIRRLKRYIWECGVRRNYKKLLAGCRSRKAKVEALKKELENLGLKGTPTLAKCKALKHKREEAAEVASLDLSNIITTEGRRPRRNNVWSLYSKPQEPPTSPEESPIRRPSTDWSRLRGVISSDGESS